MKDPSSDTAAVAKGCPSRRAPVQFGMRLFDSHGQQLGMVVLVREEYFVMRQELAINQLVVVPMVAVAGVVAGLVLLTLTPGEIELFCRVLTRRRHSPRRELLPGSVQPAYQY
jgi:hypothetical protein